MARSAKRVKKKAAVHQDGVFVQGMQALGDFVSHNPVLVGGSTAFLIALSFVSANALWYQPHAHTAPLFSTRSFDSFAPVVRAKPEQTGTTIRLDRTELPVPSTRPSGEARNAAPSDRQLQAVQALLRQLGFYQGAVDGLPGPATSNAIAAYQRKMGLAASGQVDKDVLRELGLADITGSVAPTPEKTVERPAPVKPDATQLLTKVQNGLKAFGNQGIEADGRMGAKTRAGIKEFQALFGLPQTGEADEAVYLKMKAEGLID